MFELEASFDQFRSIASPIDSEESDILGIQKPTFEKCLGPIGLEKSLVTDRIFAFFDADANGVITFEEFASGLSILCKGNFQERIECAFKGYDLDANGRVSRSELRRMFKAYFHISMELVRDVVKTMEVELLDGFDESDARPISSTFSAPIVSSGAPQDQPAKPQEDSADQGLLVLDTSVQSMSRQPSQNSPTLLNGPLTQHSDFPVMEAMSQTALEEMVNQTFMDAGAQDGDEMTLEEFIRVAEKDSNILAWFEALGSVF